MAISTKTPLSLLTFDAAITEIECGLLNLRILTLNTDFTDSDARQNFGDNVTYLKQFYERAERIVIDGKTN